MMNSRLSIAIFVLACAVGAHAQNSDDRYVTPLADVMRTIEQHYDVKIRYTPEQVEGVTVDYAPWRMRGDVYQALTGVLTPVGLSWYNSYGTNKFKLVPFEYYRWSVAQGEDFLNELEGRTPDIGSWLARKPQMREHLVYSLGISDFMYRPYGKVQTSKWRKMDGYRARNIALEVLPGYYVCGTVYAPPAGKAKHPVVLCPNGHWEGGRYREDHQIRCANLARMGAIAVSLDLFAWGEGLLQFEADDHRRAMAMSLQVIASLRYLDYLCSMPEADPSRVGVTGGSGAGSHTVLLGAIDDRITAIAPVASLACHFFGGCPCESGMPIHVRDGMMYTNNVEIAAMFVPKPMLVVSGGGDWTFMTPEIEFPYLRRMYSLFGAGDAVENVHFPDGRHDYGAAKREPVYDFFVRTLGLDLSRSDETRCTVEPVEAMLSFGADGERLPADAVHGFDNLIRVVNDLRYK